LSESFAGRSRKNCRTRPRLENAKVSPAGDCRSCQIGHEPRYSNRRKELTELAAFVRGAKDGEFDSMLA